MKFITLIALILFASTAIASDSCSEAIRNAVGAVAETQLDLMDGQLNFEDARGVIQLESDRHREVILNCKLEGYEEKYDYCSAVPKFLIHRNTIIKKSEVFSKNEKGKLQFINSHNQELARIVCP
jgi:hypothetical protein